MPLLTDTQIVDATKDDLLVLVRAINAQLGVLEHDELRRVTRAAMAQHGVMGASSIVVGVDEWDDGYFYSGILRVEDVYGNKLLLEDDALSQIDKTIDPALTQLSYGTRLGRFDQLSFALDD